MNSSNGAPSNTLPPVELPSSSPKIAQKDLKYSSKLRDFLKDFELILFKKRNIFKHIFLCAAANHYLPFPRTYAWVCYAIFQIRLSQASLSFNHESKVIAFILSPLKKNLTSHSWKSTMTQLNSKAF